MTWQELIKQNEHLFLQARRAWNVDELAIAYQIDNLAHGTNNRDTGCGMCRRSVITRCRKLYESLPKE